MTVLAVIRLTGKLSWLPEIMILLQKVICIPSVGYRVGEERGFELKQLFPLPPPFFTLSCRTLHLLLQAHPDTSLYEPAAENLVFSWLLNFLFDQMCSQIGFWRRAKTSTESGTNVSWERTHIFSSSVGALLPLFLVLRWVSQHSYPLSTDMYSQPCDSRTAVSAHGLFHQVVKHVTKLTWSRGARICFHLNQHLNEHKQLNQQEGTLWGLE